MHKIDFRALIQIEAVKDSLSRQQFLDLRSQVVAGDSAGAMKELRMILQGRDSH